MLIVSIAYLTLLERKILGGIQLRQGPNKIGRLQPWSDGLKLFNKGIIRPYIGNKLLYIISPILGLILCFFIWILYVDENINLGLIYFICISSLAIYPIVIGGWSSNSIYSLLGSYRSVAQIISYEVSLAFLILGTVCLSNSYSILYFNNFIIITLPILIMVWFSSILAELNRSPYDFAEGESELVSGFNIEYGSSLFSLFFLAEYGNILFISYFSSVVLLNSWFIILLLIIIIWVRGGLPRFRYDKLISIAWKAYLPFSLSLFMFTLSVYY